MYKSKNNRIITDVEYIEHLSRTIPIRLRHRGSSLDNNSSRRKYMYHIVCSVMSKAMVFHNILESNEQQVHQYYSRIYIDIDGKQKNNVKVNRLAERDGNLYIYITNRFWDSVQRLFNHRYNHLQEQATEYTTAYPILKEEIEILGTSTQKDYEDFMRNAVLDIQDSIAHHISNVNDIMRNRILAYEFTEKNTTVLSAGEVNIEKLIAGLNEQEKTTYQNYIHSINSDMENYIKKLTTLSTKREDYLIKMDALDRSEKRIKDVREKMDRVLRDHRVRHVEAVGSGNKLKLLIHTNTIFLDYEEEKIRHLDKSFQDKINAGYKPCIGRHTITVWLHDFNRQFKAKARNLINYHIESHTCYGSFSTPVSNAIHSRNLPQLIFLLLQILSRATLGDSAGNATMKTALYVDPEGFVEVAEDKIFIEEHLDNLEGGYTSDYYDLS